MNSSLGNNNDLHTWRRLPARILAEQVAILLNCKKDDVAYLTAAGLLEPLGDPKRNSVKWYATEVVLAKSCDLKFLNQMTKVIAKKHSDKNNNRNDEN